MQFLEAITVRITSSLFALCRKDIKVTMKKQYNQENRVLKKLLSGDEWYCQQTFRALNQAVGECDIAFYQVLDYSVILNVLARIDHLLKSYISQMNGRWKYSMK